MEVNLSNTNYIRLEHRNLEHKDYVVVNWCLGNTCNYSCAYCPDDLHNGKTPWPSEEVVMRFIDQVTAHYVGKKVYFEFTGGEVSLWKGLPQIVTYLREKGCKIGIISNGSRSLDFFSKFVDKIDHICLSFHPESADEEHFYSVVDFFAERIRTHVNFMMKPDLFNKSLAFSMRIKNIPNISVALQPLMEGLNGAMVDYTELQSKAMNNQHELLVKHIKYTKSFEYYRGAMAMVDVEGNKKPIAPQRFISSGENTWEGWNCYIGLEQIVIDMHGTIFRGWCLAGGEIGKISDEKLNLPTKPIVCPVKKCHCNLDIMATKEKVIS